MKRNRCVKIIATLGPGSSNHKMIEALYHAGADTFRVNMSHSSHAGAAEVVGMIRDVESKMGRPIGIMVDLQGPKLRVANFADDSVELKEGAEFSLDDNPAPGDATRVYFPHIDILKEVQVGDGVLLDDGKIRLKCIEASKSSPKFEVVIGGTLSNKKGASFPDTLLPLGAITEKDREDLDVALELGADWIAISFVQRPDDVSNLRDVVKGRAAILCKIEKPQAIDRIEEIIELSDAIMVARGDLGVEMPIESVPALQKFLISACRRAGKPVIVATQMLESMISSPVPTRAEVSDVATAVYDGADAIMLSAESAVGDYAGEAVAMMDQIARKTEKDQSYQKILRSIDVEAQSTGADAISQAARMIASTLSLKAIVCYTRSGATGMRASRERPETPIIVLSPVIQTARRMTMVWGVHSVVTDDAQDHEDMVNRAGRIAFQENFAKSGDRIVITVGLPVGTPGSTNTLRVAYVGSGGHND